MSARTFDADLVKNLATFRKLVPDCAEPRLVYDGEPFPARAGARCLNVRDLSRDSVFG